MGDLRVIRIDLEADSAEHYIEVAARRFSKEFFVPTEQDVGERVRVEAPFLGGHEGVRGEAIATPATRDGRRGVVVRMVQLDPQSVPIPIPGPPDEELVDEDIESFETSSSQAKAPKSQASKGADNAAASVAKSRGSKDADNATAIAAKSQASKEADTAAAIAAKSQGSKGADTATAIAPASKAASSDVATATSPTSSGDPAAAGAAKSQASKDADAATAIPATSQGSKDGDAATASAAKSQASKDADAATASAAKSQASKDADAVASAAPGLAVHVASGRAAPADPDASRRVSARRRIAAVIAASGTMVAITIFLVTAEKRTAGTVAATSGASQAATPQTIEPAGARPTPWSRTATAAQPTKPTTDRAATKQTDVAPASKPIADAPVTKPVADRATSKSATQPAAEPSPPSGVQAAKPAEKPTTDVTASPPGSEPGAGGPLATPEPLTPREKARFSCAGFGTQIDLSWSAVPGATGYMVEIARDASFSPLVETIDVAKTVTTFRPLTPGSFVWRVVARDAAGRHSSPTTVRTFSCLAK